MFSNLPHSWKPKPLASCVDNRSTKWDMKTSLPYVGLEHIEQKTGRIIGFGDSATVTSSKTVFEPNDVLLGKLRPNLRKFWKADRKGICSTDILVLRAKQGLHPHYLLAIVQSEPFNAFACSDAVGTKMPRTSWRRLKAIEFPIPPLSEQQRIAEVLSSVDASIQATQAVIEQAERVKRGLMEELLTGGLGSAAIERGEVPEGWRQKRLGEIAKITTGKTPSTKQEEFWCGSIPFVTPSDLDGSLFVKETERSLTAVGAEKSKLIPAGSLMFTCIASIGKAAISETECVTNQQINACTFASREETLFYHYQLQHRLNELLTLAGQTAVAIINKGKFSSFSVFVPPLSELSRIAQILFHFDKFIAKQKSIIEQQLRTKRGLMDDLLTGKVRTV